MSLGFNKAHYLSSGKIRKKKTEFLQEERPGNEIYIDPITNPFGESGALTFNRTVDSADTTQRPQLRIGDATDFNFTTNDDFTIETWLYIPGKSSAGEPWEPGFDSLGEKPYYRFNMWMTDFGETEGNTPYIGQENLVHNGWNFQFEVAREEETVAGVAWMSAPPDEYISTYDSAGDLVDSAGVGRNYIVYGRESPDPFSFNLPWHDSAGSEREEVYFEDWNHIAASHKAGEGLRLYLNGRCIAGPYVINILPTTTTQYLHIGGLGLILVSEPSKAAPNQQGYIRADGSTDRFFGFYDDDGYGFSNEPFFISQTRISSVARYTTGSFIPQKHGNDNDTLLLVDFTYDGSADSEIFDNDFAPTTYQQSGRQPATHITYRDYFGLDSSGLDSVGSYTIARLTDDPAPKFGSTCFGSYDINNINSKIIMWCDPDMSPFTNPANEREYAVYDSVGDTRRNGWIDSYLEQEVFTLEQWVYFDTPDHSQTTFDNRSLNILFHQIEWHIIALRKPTVALPGRLEIYANPAFEEDSAGDFGTRVFYEWEPNIQQWYHLAITKGPNAEIRVYIDGVEQFVHSSIQYDEDDAPVDSGGTWRDLTKPWFVRQGTNFGIYQSTNRNFAFFGQSGNGGGDGKYPYYIFHDELRLSKILRYDGDFTPPTSAFTSDANTVILWHFDGNPGDDNFLDDAS